MKISCTKKEFAKLVRDCERINIERSSCSGCVLDGICGEHMIEDVPEIEFEIVEEA